MSRCCYTIRKGKDKGIHIPGCIGCAVGGHAHCTCPSDTDRDEDGETQMDRIERKLDELLDLSWKGRQ
jgi:hypothetical protein